MIRVREAGAEDAEQLLQIYAPYVTDTVISFEYEVPSLEEFRQRICNTLKAYPYLVAEESDTGRIAGYVYASAFKGREAYNWSVETSIYVRKGEHGRGIGRLLYENLEKILYHQNVCNVCACIAYPHPQSEAFHKSMGYQTVAHFHKSGYKNGMWIDMIWMEKHLREHEAVPEAWIPYAELRELRG